MKLAVILAAALAADATGLVKRGVTTGIAGGGLEICNGTPVHLTLSLSQVGPLYYENWVPPGECMTRNGIGNVWFTIHAKPSSMGHDINNWDVAWPIIGAVCGAVSAAVLAAEITPFLAPAAIGRMVTWLSSCVERIIGQATALRALVRVNTVVEELELLTVEGRASMESMAESYYSAIESIAEDSPATGRLLLKAANRGKQGMQIWKLCKVALLGVITLGAGALDSLGAIRDMAAGWAGYYANCKRWTIRPEYAHDPAKPGKPADLMKSLRIEGGENYDCHSGATGYVDVQWSAPANTDPSSTGRLRWLEDEYRKAKLAHLAEVRAVPIEKMLPAIREKYEEITAAITELETARSDLKHHAAECGKMHEGIDGACYFSSGGEYTCASTLRGFCYCGETKKVLTLREKVNGLRADLTRIEIESAEDIKWRLEGITNGIKRKLGLDTAKYD